jgi:hypothetical protein
MNVYTHTFADGSTVDLVPFDRLPSGVFRKARQANEMEMTFMLIEAATDEAGLAIIDAQPLPSLQSLFADWSTAAGADLPSS